MDTRVWVFGLGVTAIMAAEPIKASAAGEPLLVVVDASPEVAAEAGEIRRAIAAEVHLAAFGPTAAEAEGAERALIVGVDRNRIAVALRGPYAAPLVRLIPAPADHAARVRAIAWLAGNLVRDQVSGIVTETIPAASTLADMPALPAPVTEQAMARPPAPGPSTEPPAYQAPAADVSAVSARPAARAEIRRWVLSLEAGPIVGVGLHLGGGSTLGDVPLTILWHLEARRFSDDQRFFLGASAEGTSSPHFGTGVDSGGDAPETFGAAALCGWARRRGSWALEESLGLGLDIGPRALTGTMRAGLYGAASAAVSHTVGNAAALFLRLGAHISTVDEQDWFASSTIGVSYGLW